MILPDTTYQPRIMSQIEVTCKPDHSAIKALRLLTWFGNATFKVTLEMAVVKWVV